MKTQRLLDWLAAAVLVFAALAAYFLHGKNTAATTAPAADENNAVRVEIQRYLGYEALPARYLSLPYDLTMNNNVYLPILDIGVLLLVFVPIAVLLGFWAKRGPAVQSRRQRAEAWALPVLVVLSCFLLLVVSTANGHISGLDMGIVKPADIGQYLEKTAFADAPAGVVSAIFYQQFLGIYQAVVAPVLGRVSGAADAVTYPVLLLFFGLFLYAGMWVFRRASLGEKALLVFLYAYLFFWLLLSAGIVWYGLLAFPLLTAFVFSALSGQGRVGEGLPGKVGRYAFFGVVGCYLLMGFAHRFSNLKLNIMANDSFAGKRLYDPSTVKYLTGEYSGKEVIDAFYKNLSKALASINTEDQSLIYNVGTRFNFFIRSNDRRIFKDNQLDFFNQVILKHNTKVQVTGLLKASGFRYIMVDFNTPTGDRTPEQSLVERYQKFLLLLNQNPGLELLATNRVVKETLNGQVQYKHAVFGEIQDPGSYAIYKIK